VKCQPRGRGSIPPDPGRCYLGPYRPRSHAPRGNAFWDALRPGLDHLGPSELLIRDAERRGRHSHAERGNEG
jgi:hypothetical protein